MSGSPGSTLFLSHNAKDKPFVRRLAAALEERGFRCWIDESEIRFGDSLVRKVSDAIERIDFVVAVISRNSVDSNWVRQELDRAMTKEIANRRVVVIPVVTDRCDIPFFLRNKLYADFSDPGAFDATLDRLAESLRHHSGEGPRSADVPEAGRIGRSITRNYRPTLIPMALDALLVLMAALMLAGSKVYFRARDPASDLGELEGHIGVFCLMAMAAGCAELIRGMLLMFAVRVDPVLAEDVGTVAVANLFSRRYRRMIARHRRNWLFMVCVAFEGGVLVTIAPMVLYAVRIARFL